MKKDNLGGGECNLHRFFVRPENLRANEVVLGEQQAHQICNVLRLKEAERIVVLDNLGDEFEVELAVVAGNRVLGRIVKRRQNCNEPDVKICLFQSMLKRDKFEFVLQKCTEVGVAEFVPVVCERSVVQDKNIKAGKLQRWRKIITEAAEQSHRGRVPGLGEPIDFAEAIGMADDFDCALIASTQSGTGLRKALSKNGKDIKSVGLFIGPEGGSSSGELERCRQVNVIEFGMGGRILRTETAAIVASSLTLYESGQMEG